MTPNQRLADLILTREHDVGLVAWLQARVDEGQSHRSISRRLWEATGGEVEVSNVTVGAWVHELTDPEAA